MYLVYLLFFLIVHFIDFSSFFFWSLFYLFLLIFIVTILLLTLGFKSSFSNFQMIVYILYLRVFLFLEQVCTAINILHRTQNCFAACHKFWKVMLLFSFASKCFLISSLIFFTDQLFSFCLFIYSVFFSLTCLFFLFPF